MSSEKVFDSIVIGGGAAGLTAAMILARSCRQVALIDAGQQSNKAALVAHNVFANDGKKPQELYAFAQQQLREHPEVSLFLNTEAIEAKRKDGLFEVTLSNQKVLHTKSILFAQGANYTYPHIHGINELWGKKIWHCPYCDGYEARGKKLVCIGCDDWVNDMSYILPTWTRSLTWIPFNCELSLEVKNRVLNAGGKIITSKIVSIHDIETGDPKNGIEIIFADGSVQQFDQGIIETVSQPRDILINSFDCKLDDKCRPVADNHYQTSIEGVYVAGDQTNTQHQVNMAVASGHKAALSINVYLAKLEREAEKSL